ncbi:MAG: hypothetical protein FJX29_09170, partial [Alphaproteobacteria bacterium]|nr:hypothetical protein [Alphaproteobacteria bacterium]
MQSQGDLNALAQPAPRDPGTNGDADAQPDTIPALKARRRRWPAPLRWIAIAAGVTGGLGLLAAGGLFYLIAQLERGPIAVSGLSARIADALQKRAGEGQSVHVGPASIEKSEHGPALAIDGLSLRGASGDIIVAAPKAVISLDPLALLAGSFTPKRIDVVGLTLRLSVLPDGALAVSAGDKPVIIGSLAARVPGASVPRQETTTQQAPTQQTTTQQPPSQEQRPAASPAPGSSEDSRRDEPRDSRAAMRPLAVALSQLVQASAGPQSPLGLLTQAGVRQGRLIFEDQTRGTTTAFDDLDLSMERAGEEAVLRIAANGPRGRWTMDVGAIAAGEGYGGGSSRTLDVRIANLYLDDIALVAGLRDLPFDMDAPMALRLRLGVSHDGEFRLAQGNLSLGGGMLSFRHQDQEPVLFERIGGAFHWNDETRKIVIEPTSFHSQKVFAQITGTVTPPAGNEAPVWRFELSSAAPLRISAALKGESAVELKSMTFSGEFDTASTSLPAFALRAEGPGADIRIDGTASLVPGAQSLQLTIGAARTQVRTVLQLWPSGAAPQLRQWLHDHLHAGLVEHGSLRVSLSHEDMALLNERKNLPAHAIAGEYHLSGANLSYLPGAPPLRGLKGHSKFTGDSSEFTATAGYIEGAGRNRVDLAGGKFTTRQVRTGLFQAQVNASLGGNVDALARILGEPGLKSYAAIQLDPSTLKGRFDGSLDIGFRLGDHAGPPKPVVRAEVTGTNLTIERLIGKERMQAGTLKVSIDGADLTAKGSGRIFDAPATISFEKRGRGEIAGNISATIDDAARRRLGWAVPQVTGPVV